MTNSAGVLAFCQKPHRNRCRYDALPKLGSVHEGTGNKEYAMKKYLVILAAALLLITGGIASAQTKMPRNMDKYGASGPTTGQGGVTRAPSSTNPRATAPNGAMQAPHAVPENGGAPMRDVPGGTRRR
jgi:hypothetical protein